MARRSKLVAFRLPEREAWKLARLGVRNGMSLSQMAKLIVQNEVGRTLTDAEARAFFVEVERPRMREERVQVEDKARAVNAPAMVEPPSTDEDFDSLGLPICPMCKESAMSDDAIGHQPCVGIIDSETGEYVCHRKTCPANDNTTTFTHAAFIGLPVSTPPVRSTYWDEEAGIVRYEDDDSPVRS